MTRWLDLRASNSAPFADFKWSDGHPDFPDEFRRRVGVKLISLHFARGFISSGAWKFIGKTNVMINERGKRKRAREAEKKRTGADRATVMTERAAFARRAVANQSTLFLLVSHIAQIYLCTYFVYINMHAYTRAHRENLIVSIKSAEFNILHKQVHPL